MSLPERGTRLQGKIDSGDEVGRFAASFHIQGRSSRLPSRPLLNRRLDIRHFQPLSPSFEMGDPRSLRVNANRRHGYRSTSLYARFLRTLVLDADGLSPEPTTGRASYSHPPLHVGPYTAVVRAKGGPLSYKRRVVVNSRIRFMTRSPSLPTPRRRPETPCPDVGA